MFNPWSISAAGAAIGVLYGLFGVGSAFATPVLSLLGVSGMAAVVAPLPALLPGSAAGAWSYTRGGKVDWTIVRWTLIGAVPAAVVGAVASPAVGGPILLVLSGVLLLVAGLRTVRRGQISAVADDRALARRNRAWFVISAAAGVGFVSGLLANGGGFLLVPLFLVVLGLDMHEAAGTSLVVAAALTVPTIGAHTMMGDLDWLLSARFALGMVPGALAGAWLAQRLPTTKMRTAFGALLIGVAVWFLARQGLSMLPA